MSDSRPTSAFHSDNQVGSDVGSRHVDGRAQGLPLGDGEADVVHCERVFQHLDDPERAAAEIARILRPGGRVALLDTDWATSILHPGDPGVVAAVMGGARAAAANPHAGRAPAGQLAAAGLKIDELGSQALIQRHDAVNRPLIRMLGEAGVRRELITERQRDRLYADLEEAAERGALHMSVTMFGVIARRPAA
ncbi:methyltransferase domain-containing protein [Streptomyces liangshanensis]|uniref:methyltransferase domain-containing protein n=1 Tax=Streptomyces liangshanensis TaxID=2717324 RepID=UPI0036DAA4E0